MSTAETQQAAPRSELPMVTVPFWAWLFGAPMTEAVMFYPTGDRDGEAAVAHVRKCDTNGRLDLIVHRGPMGERRDATRNINDPYWKDHQNILRRDGAWDYGPGKSPVMEESTFEVEAAAAEVVRLWNNNVRPSTIEQRIRGMLTIGGRLIVEPKTFVQYALGKFVPVSRPVIRK